MQPQEMTKQMKTTMTSELSNVTPFQFTLCEDNLHYAGVKDIDPTELAKNSKQVIIVDVRQPNEFAGELGHIPNAKLMVLDELNETMNTLPKDKTIVFVCRSGGRSARATHLATEMGFTHVYNMKGGMLLWNELHLPTEV